MTEEWDQYHRTVFINNEPTVLSAEFIKTLLAFHPKWYERMCERVGPDGHYECMRKRGHNGLHIAYGVHFPIVAVWD